jgi:hypothetical protein
LIALTGLSGPTYVARSVAAGFDRHLLKPAGLTAIKAALDVESRAPSLA